jgi:hypothetical protein
MKLKIHAQQRLLKAVIPFAVLVPVALLAPPTPTTAKSEIKHSVFVYPSNPSEGRDPFYPNSTRPYFYAKPTKPATAATASLTELTLKSILGTPPQLVAIINNHAFAAGDEGDVFTKTGRMHIRCVKIDAPTSIVTVEANGVSAELTLKKKP